MLLFRVDNRLIHGQIIEAWLPFLHAKNLVVANDALAQDNLRQQIISMAIPTRINIYFKNIKQLVQILQTCANETTLVILENCADLHRALHLEIPKPCINIGNLHFGEGKKQLLSHIAVTNEEYDFLKEIDAKFILDFRAVPTEKPRGIHEL